MSLEISYNIKRREKDSRTGSRKSTSKRKSNVYTEALPFSYSKKKKEEPPLPSAPAPEPVAVPEPKKKSSSQKSEVPDYVVSLRRKLEESLNKYDTGEDAEISTLLTEICSLFSDELAKIEVPLISPPKPAPVLDPTNYQQQEQALQKLIRTWSDEERAWEAMKDRYTTTTNSHQPQQSAQPTSTTTHSNDTPTAYTNNSHLQTAQFAIQRLCIQMDDLKPPLKELEHYGKSADEQYSALIPRIAAKTIPQTSAKNLIKSLRDL